MNLNFRVRMSGLICVLAAVIVSAVSISSNATGSLSQLETESSNISAELSGINQELVLACDELDEINQMIALTEAQMSKTSEDLETSKEEEAIQYENMKTRIQYMYEAGETSFLELLFQADSIVDFINKTDFINNVMEYDRDMLDELITTRENIEFEEENILAEQATLLDLQADAEEKKAELEATASELQVDLASVQQDIATKREEERLAAEKAEQEQAEAEQGNNNAGTGSGNTDDGSTGGGNTDNGSTGGGSTDNGNSGNTSTEDDYEATTSELDVFAAILDCEARATYDSRLAVATVIMNRVASGKFPNTITGVIYQKGQFSPTWTGKLDGRLELGASSLSYQVAEDAINGARLSSVSDCYYFLYAGGTSRDGVVIGGNVFFKSW